MPLIHGSPSGRQYLAAGKTIFAPERRADIESWAGWMSMRLFPPAAAQGEQGEGRQAEGGSGGLGDGLETYRAV